MPTTRSGAKQSHVENLAGSPPEKTRSPSSTRKRAATTESSSAKKEQSSKSTPAKSETSKKRKTAATDASKPLKPNKKGKSDSGGKQAPVSGKLTGDVYRPIIINRSPVLQLWAATVTSFLTPDLPWTTCLSAGNAISSLCAISKGRSIGAIQPADHDGDDKSATKKRQSNSDSTRTIKVMGFALPIKEDAHAVMVGGKPKPLLEGSLKRKFGEENYDLVREAFTQSLETWKGDEDELDGKAFQMYEKLRPTVPGGQKGWGRKGELNLDEVKSIVRK